MNEITQKAMNSYTSSFFHYNWHYWIAVTGILFFLLSCEQLTELTSPRAPLVQTPREAYLAALDSNGLAETQMAKTWQSAGVQALTDSVLVEAPFRETGYFRAADPGALAYQIKLKTGELLRLALTTEPDSTLFFVDLFQIEATDSTLNHRHLFNAENYQTDSMAFEVPQEGTYLLRIQPELLASCRYTLDLIVQPVYGAFPVSGKGNRDIWSFYGDPRDGGKRDHKGIDIFARRGTPVVAATDGMVRSVRDRGLGGKQVWLADYERRQSLYYAHLDSQLVYEGQQLKAGDTLGMIGNTGNARNTRPHLHFGIYRRGYGAIDPYPFVATRPDQSPTVRADTSRLGQLARVRRQNTRLLVSPENRAATRLTLERHLPLQVVAATSNWYRVRSPDGRTGYLPANSLENTDRPIRKVTIAQVTELRIAPNPGAAPVSAAQPEEEVAVIGQNEGYQLVVQQEGAMGWIPVADR